VRVAEGGVGRLQAAVLSCCISWLGTCSAGDQRAHCAATNPACAQHVTGDVPDDNHNDHAVTVWLQSTFQLAGTVLDVGLCARPHPARTGLGSAWLLQDLATVVQSPSADPPRGLLHSVTELPLFG
jgi:hypothetical protein